MKDLFAFSLTVFTGLIAMMNPIAIIPIFLGMVGSSPRETRVAIATKACVVAAIILVSFILLGKLIFLLFGLTIPAFKIAGGIIVAKVGFSMLQSKPTQLTQASKDFAIDEGIAICPLAIPIIAGPGAIVTAMDFVSDTTYVHFIIVVLIALCVVGINYLCLKYGELIVEKLGLNVINVLDKIMGIILTVMGTGMVISGISGCFHGLFR